VEVICLFANLNPEAIIISDDRIDKETAITRLDKQACDVFQLPDSKEILDKVIDRESKLSTGIGLEIAVPHCRTPQVGHVAMAVMLVRQGIDYNSIDGKPVKMLFLIISPERDITGHLICLSVISQAVSDETTRMQLLNSKTPNELYDYLNSVQ